MQSMSAHLHHTERKIERSLILTGWDLWKKKEIFVFIVWQSGQRISQKCIVNIPYKIKRYTSLHADSGYFCYSGRAWAKQGLSSAQAIFDNPHVWNKLSRELILAWGRQERFEKHEALEEVQVSKVSSENVHRFREKLVLSNLYGGHLIQIHNFIIKFYWLLSWAHRRPMDKSVSSKLTKAISK